MADGAYISVDWGTTNRRIYVIGDDGDVIQSMSDDFGVMAMAGRDYGAQIALMRERFGALPVIAAGMVGSNRGWVTAPYCDTPVDVEALGRNAVRLGDDVVIVPGVAHRAGRVCDVVRGEEVQVLGAISAGLAPDTALFCQPGTHNKWVVTESARITSFATAMTGELFSILKEHSVLSGMLDGAVCDGPAFREGCQRGAGAKDLTTALFQARAAALLGVRESADSAAYVSGLLIGADVGAREDIRGRDVVLLASGVLCELYAAAIGEVGGQVVRGASEVAFVAGVHAIWKAIR